MAMNTCKPHGNSKSKDPFIPTKKSTLEKLTGCGEQFMRWKQLLEVWVQIQLLRCLAMKGKQVCVLLELTFAVLHTKLAGLTH